MFRLQWPLVGIVLVSVACQKMVVNRWDHASPVLTADRPENDMARLIKRSITDGDELVTRVEAARRHGRWAWFDADTLTALEENNRDLKVTYARLLGVSRTRGRLTWQDALDAWNVWEDAYAMAAASFPEQRRQERRRLEKDIAALRLEQRRLLAEARRAPEGLSGDLRQVADEIDQLQERADGLAKQLDELSGENWIDAHRLIDQSLDEARFSYWYSLSRLPKRRFS